MNASSLNQINSKLKSIPDTFLNDVIDYLEYLSFKTGSKDWADKLSEEELKLIKAGEDDIKEGRVFSNETALKKIKAHLKAKQ